MGVSACSDGGGGGDSASHDSDDDAFDAAAGAGGRDTGSNQGGESQDDAATSDDDDTASAGNNPGTEAQAGSSSSSDDEPPSQSERCEPGELRCGCYPNGTCNAGLSCLSNLCVEPASTGGAGNGSATGGTTSVTETGGASSVTGTGGTTSVTETGGASSVTETGGTTSVTETGGASSVTETGGTTSATEAGGTTSVTETGGATSVEATGGSANENGTGGAGNQVDTGIIENFSTCDPYLSEVGGRSGEWYGFSDTGLNFTWAVSLPGTGWADQSCAAWAIAGCNVEDSCNYGGIGFELAAGNAYDLSGWSGLTIELESDDDVWLVVKTLDGGYFGAWLGATEGNATRNVGFDELYVMDNSEVPTLDLALVTEIQFTPASPEAFGFAIHLIALR